MPDFGVGQTARMSPGLSGAELANAVGVIDRLGVHAAIGPFYEGGGGALQHPDTGIAEHVAI